MTVSEFERSDNSQVALEAAVALGDFLFGSDGENGTMQRLGSSLYFARDIPSIHENLRLAFESIRDDGCYAISSAKNLVVARREYSNYGAGSSWLIDSDDAVKVDARRKLEGQKLDAFDALARLTSDVNSFYDASVACFSYNGFPTESLVADKEEFGSLSRKLKMALHKNSHL
jgi:hypothetical protein